MSRRAGSVVMFSDFQCSFCKEEAKVIRKNSRRRFRRKPGFISKISLSNRFTLGKTRRHRRTMRLPSETRGFLGFPRLDLRAPG